MTHFTIPRIISGASTTFPTASHSSRRSLSLMSQPKLVWPRSDGDKSRWPEYTSTRPADRNAIWYEKLSPDPKYTLYRTKVGRFVADEIKNLKSIPNAVIDLPEGYALFGHNKPQPNGTVREDVYMFGSKLVTKFRSPQEFFGHAQFLFDTSKSLTDHTLCPCKYNSQSALAIQKRSAAGLGPKRTAEDRDTPEPKRARPSPVEKLDVVVPERAIDAKTQRRFRKGELVFFRIPTIAAAPGTDLPEITHWPGLVASITPRTIVEGDDSEAAASSSAAWSLAGGVAPKTLNRKVTTRFEHAIRPLGMFSNSHEVIRQTSDLLPFAAGEQLLGGLEGWDKIGKESSRILNEGVQRESQIDIPAPEELEGAKLEERWKRRWGERIKFSDMPCTWDAAVLRLGVALKTARTIASCWSQTDKIELLPRGSLLSREDLTAIENRKKTLYQGVWFQGERVWADDMVRLRKSRTELPQDALAAPSPGSETRGVFLQARLIALENQTPAGTRGPDVWRCMLYGDVYELADSAVRGDSQAEEPSWPAPKGYYYRRLNSEGSEAALDIFDVAGRVYPDLMDADSAWFYMPDAQNGARTGRVKAGEAVLELVGLKSTPRPGHCSVWKEDLYVVVRSATSDIEREAREHYAKLLAKALGYTFDNGVVKSSSDGALLNLATPVLQCDSKNVTITPSSGNKLQSPTIAVDGPLQPALEAAAGHLRAGRTVAFPTETVYGLGAHSLNPDAVAKVYAIKNRPADNPLIMHVSSLDMLQRLLPPGYTLSPLYLALVEAFWPGPLTLLFPASNPPDPPAPQTNAIRMPNHPLALALIATADLPISAPSANSSGRPSPTRAEHVSHDLDGREGLGCILDGGACGVGVESTVVDGLAWLAGGGGAVNVLRPGGLSVEDIAQAVRDVDARFGGETQILVHGKPWKIGTPGTVDTTSANDDKPPSTPGMKYRHYSPRVPVHLLLPSNIFPRPAISSNITDPAALVRNLTGGKRVGILLFDNSPLSHALTAAGVPASEVERRSLGPDTASAAQRLFDAFLSLETAGVAAILVEGCASDGIGLAVMERVGKAVGGGGVTAANLAQGKVGNPGAEGTHWVEV